MLYHCENEWVETPLASHEAFSAMDLILDAEHDSREECHVPECEDQAETLLKLTDKSCFSLEGSIQLYFVFNDLWMMCLFGAFFSQ
jgi:hypothetical protein